MAVAKRPSDQGHLRPEVTLIDGNARPDAGEQFFLGDDLAGALDQNNQEVERTHPDVNGPVGFEQKMRRGPQAKRPKSDCTIGCW